MTQAEVIAHEERIASGRRHKAVSSFAPFAPAETKESDIHNAIIAHCKLKRWIYFHGSTAHRAMRTLGEADFTILADNGRVFFIEAKTKTGKLSPEQLAIKVWAESLGHQIHTIRSMPEFLELVNSTEWKKE